MKIFVRVKPSAKKEKISQTDETHFVVAVREPPREGRANQAIEDVLARHFGTTVNRVRIISGHASRNKIVDIVS